MSRLFGPATQNGIVVQDLDAALAYWTGTLGVGPFYRADNLPNEYYFQREVELPPPAMSIALGNWGDLQIELVCPHGEGDSTWHQFLKQRGGGLHHVSIWSSRFDAHLRLAAENGLKLEARGKVAGGSRYAYFQSGRPDEPLLEISDLTETAAAIFEHVRKTAANWDGRDAIRSLG